MGEHPTSATSPSTRRPAQTLKTLMRGRQAEHDGHQMDTMSEAPALAKAVSRTILSQREVSPLVVREIVSWISLQR